MREIKFRAWGKLTKEMHSLGPTEKFTPEGELEPNKNKVYMQYTGLKDKHGVEIYEGDVLNDGEDSGYVEYMSEFSSYVIDFWKSPANHSRGVELGTWLDSESEIIGNVYENPELLEK